MKSKKKRDPYKCTRFTISRTYPSYGVVKVDIPAVILVRLEVMARKHSMPIDNLLSCCLGFIAFHGESVLKEVFEGAERGRRLTAIWKARR